MRAKTRRWVGVVLFAAVLFVIVVVLCLRGQGAQARQYSVSFADVVKYLSVQFKTDITDVQNAEVWGPHFLDPGTLYWVQTETNIPNRMVRFKIWYYQVGGEDYTFTVTNNGPLHTEVSLNHVVHFIVTSRGCGVVERRILDAIGEDLKKVSQGSASTSTGSDSLGQPSSAEYGKLWKMRTGQAPSGRNEGHSSKRE